MRTSSPTPTALMLRLALSTALFLAASFAGSAHGAETTITDVTVGFEGAWKAGRWTPLEIRFRHGEPSIESVVVETVTADPEGSAAIQFSDPLPVEAGSEASVRTVFQSGRLGSDLTVRLRAVDGSPLAERRLRSGSELLPGALPKGTALWVLAGGFGRAGRESAEGGLPALEDVTTASPQGSLPADPLAYAAADVLVIRGDLSPTIPQSEAIRRWVAYGGRLVIALGRFTETFRDGSFAKWVPVTVGETVPLRDLSLLEEYSGTKRRLPGYARVRAARLGDAAEVLLDSPDGPLIVRGTYGFGQVTVFAFDLDAPPFAAWAGLPAVLRRAIVADEGSAGRGDRIAAANVTDLSTQLGRAQETSSDLNRPTVGTALLLLLVYAAVVGPLDYLLVHRVLKRPAMTWITLPLIVVGAAWWLQRSAVATNGTASHFHQFDLIDLDASSGMLRGRTDVTLYGGASMRGRLTVDPRKDVAPSAGPPQLAWSAPAESTFGGIYRDAAGGLFRPEYVFQPPAAAATVDEIPLLVWSSRRFAATWQRDESRELVDADLISRGSGMIEGMLTHRFPGTIRDYVVAYGNRVLVPVEDQWRSGKPIDLGSSAFERRDLVSFLTRRKESKIARKQGEGGEDYIVTETTYDPLATDVGGIVRMLSFHKAAGGTGYTGLTNVVRPSDDLTPLLRAGRAVLVGRLETPVTDVAVTADDATFGSSRHEAFIRLVLPASRSDAEPSRTLAPTKPSVVPDQPRSARPE